MQCLRWAQHRSDVAERSVRGPGCALLEPVAGSSHPVPGVRVRAAPEAVLLLSSVPTKYVRSSSLLHTSGSVVSLMLSQKPSKAEGLSCLWGR